MSKHNYISAATFTDLPLRKMTTYRYERSVGNLALIQDGGKAVRTDDAQWEQRNNGISHTAASQMSAVT
jgi:hypothetical protein